MNNNQNVILDFYKQQSCMTDPKDFAYLYTVFPLDLNIIRHAIQTLILHFWDGKIYQHHIPLKRLFEVETRYVSKMLQKILLLEASPLTKPRALANRLVGSCRDYAILLCSILRYQGVPARVRVAFNTYFFSDYNHDEVVLEYWHATQQRWVLVDPRVTDLHIQAYRMNFDFDLLDVPRDKMLVAGAVWQMVRAGKFAVEKFGGGDRNKNKGLWYIRDRLIQDFAALNSMEMQLWDVWGAMLANNAGVDDNLELSFLDQIALLTIHPDKYFADIRMLYKHDARLNVPHTILNVGPIYKKKEQILNI